jgi:hypothetical protein
MTCGPLRSQRNHRVCFKPLNERVRHVGLPFTLTVVTLRPNCGTYTRFTACPATETLTCLVHTLPLSRIRASHAQHQGCLIAGGRNRDGASGTARCRLHKGSREQNKQHEPHLTTHLITCPQENASHKSHGHDPLLPTRGLKPAATKPQYDYS